MKPCQNGSWIGIWFAGHWKCGREEKICFKSSGQEIGVSCGSIACMFILSFSSFNSLHKKLIFKSNNPWNPLIGLVDSA